MPCHASVIASLLCITVHTALALVAIQSEYWVDSAELSILRV